MFDACTFLVATQHHHYFLSLWRRWSTRSRQIKRVASGRRAFKAKKNTGTHLIKSIKHCTNARFFCLVFFFSFFLFLLSFNHSSHITPFLLFCSHTHIDEPVPQRRHLGLKDRARLCACPGHAALEDSLPPPAVRAPPLLQKANKSSLTASNLVAARLGETNALLAKMVAALNKSIELKNADLTAGSLAACHAPCSTRRLCLGSQRRWQHGRGQVSRPQSGLKTARISSPSSTRPKKTRRPRRRPLLWPRASCPSSSSA